MTLCGILANVNPSTGRESGRVSEAEAEAGETFLMRALYGVANLQESCFKKLCSGQAFGPATKPQASTAASQLSVPGFHARLHL